MQRLAGWVERSVTHQKKSIYANMPFIPDLSHLTKTSWKRAALNTEGLKGGAKTWMILGPSLFMLLFFLFTLYAAGGYGPYLKPLLRDRLSAQLANTVGAVVDPL